MILIIVFAIPFISPIISLIIGYIVGSSGSEWMSKKLIGDGYSLIDQVQATSPHQAIQIIQKDNAA